MRVLFIDQTAGHNPHKLYEKPTGGILTSLTKIPEYLASKGHEVYVRSTYDKEEIVNGVHYIIENSKIDKWDVCVFNRNVLPRDFVAYNKKIGAKCVWWLHDIVDPRYLSDNTFQAMDKVIALSEYCKKTYKDFYSLPEDIFTVIPNGVDSDIFYPSIYEERNPNIYLTASSLIKGYLPLDITLVNLQRHNPDIDFRIYSSQKLHGLENSKSQQLFLEKMKQAGAHVYHPVNPKILAEVMRKAWCLLMPNSYPEICSNLLLQARACGLPVVTSNTGANPEFLEDNKTGLITKYHPHDIHSWTVEFAAKACHLYLNRDLHKDISLETSKNIPTWDQIGEIWNEELLKITAK